jgi:hypothetical protein
MNRSGKVPPMQTPPLRRLGLAFRLHRRGFYVCLAMLVVGSVATAVKPRVVALGQRDGAFVLDTLTWLIPIAVLAALALAGVALLDAFGEPRRPVPTQPKRQVWPKQK